MCLSDRLLVQSQCTLWTSKTTHTHITHSHHICQNSVLCVWVCVCVSVWTYKMEKSNRKQFVAKYFIEDVPAKALYRTIISLYTYIYIVLYSIRLLPHWLLYCIVICIAIVANSMLHAAAVVDGRRIIALCYINKVWQCVIYCVLLQKHCRSFVSCTHCTAQPLTDTPIRVVFGQSLTGQRVSVYIPIRRIYMSVSIHNFYCNFTG